MRYDGEKGLYWMSVRAYDPELGRFLSRDPLNRVPLVFSEQPYVYAGNNPLIHVDPSGQRFYIQGMSGEEQEQVNKWMIKAARTYRTKPSSGKPSSGDCRSDGSCGCYNKCSSGKNIPPSGQPVGPSDWGACDKSPHPDWCSRYYDYSRAGHPRKNSFDEADYFYFVISAGEGVAAQEVIYYIKASGYFISSSGVNLGASFSFLGVVTLAAGYGLMLTKGTPTGSQVWDFLVGISVSVTAGTIASLGLVHSFSEPGITAEQYEVDTAIAQAAVGVSATNEVMCPPAYFGPFIVATCVMDW